MLARCVSLQTFYGGAISSYPKLLGLEDIQTTRKHGVGG